MDVMKSLLGIDGPGLESGRVRSPCTQVAEVGRQKRTSGTRDRPLDYQEYSRKGVLEETKSTMNH